MKIISRTEWAGLQGYKAEARESKETILRLNCQLDDLQKKMAEAEQDQVPYTFMVIDSDLNEACYHAYRAKLNAWWNNKDENLIQFSITLYDRSGRCVGFCANVIVMWREDIVK